MAKPDSLIPGNFYFRVSFYDEDPVIPNIETWIYDKKIVDENGNDLWLFREPISPEIPEEELESIVLDEHQIASAIDIQELQKLLTKIADLQPPLKASSTNKNDFHQTGPDFSEVEKEIDHFLYEEKSDAILIGIKYSLFQGLSLVKRKGGIALVLSIECKIQPEIEKTTRAFFQKRKLMPDQDYLSNRGRIRILAYALPIQKNEICDIVVNVFKDIFEVAPGDQFTFRRKSHNGPTE